MPKFRPKGGRKMSLPITDPDPVYWCVKYDVVCVTPQLAKYNCQGCYYNG